MDKRSTALLHVEFYGDPTRPLLVMLHGLLGSSRMWTDVAEDLKDEYHIVAIDLLGFGRSPKPRGNYDLKEHLDFLEGTIRHYKLKRPEMLVGYSLGSVLSNYAIKKRMILPKRLLMIGPPIYPTKGEMSRRIKRSPTPRIFRRGPVSAALQSVKLRTPRLARTVAKLTHPGLPLFVVDDANVVPYRVYIRTRRQILEKRTVIRRLPRVGALGILVGVSDRYADIAHLAELVKHRGELRVIDGHGHSLPFTAPEEVVRMIHDLSVQKPRPLLPSFKREPDDNDI